MVLARALTFGGAVALLASSASPWFSYAPGECGWTCYSPLGSDVVPVAFARYGPSTAYDGLGPWVAAALVALLLIAVLALWWSVGGRRRPQTWLARVSLGPLAIACAAGIAVRTATQPAILPAPRAGNSHVFVEAAAYVGVGAAIVTAVGVVLLARLESRAA
jgi:hypothetical protein